MSIIPHRSGAGWLSPGVGEASARLQRLGLGAGDRLGLGLLDHPDTVALIQAAFLAGVVLVPFNRRLDPATVAEQADRARLAWALADANHPLAAWPGCRSASATPRQEQDGEDADATSSTASHEADAIVRPAVLTRPSSPSCPPQADPPHPVPVFSSTCADDAEALVLFTSGTTGRSKAARIPCRALRHALAASCARLDLGSDDVWLGCLPLDHIAGMGNALRQTVAGYRLVQMARFDAAAANRHLDQDGITGVSLVPTQLHRLVADRAGRPWPRHLRTLLVGGAPLDPDLRARCTALGCAPRQTYGLTECCAMVTCQTEPGEDCGRALDGVELRIRDGLIAVRGPTVFLGYDDIPDGGPAADGWFCTGDHGVLDPDGRLTVLGRRSDLILSGGENVYPSQVEARLRAIPGISDAGVVGLADAEWGQVVAAALVADGAGPDPAALAAALAALPGPWRPRRLAWVPELPRTASGKLRRDALAAELFNQENAGDPRKEL